METTAFVFKALSEPIRLRILTLLLRGERCVCDLMAVLDMPQSTVSRHLAYLKNAGLVSGRRQGVWMYYRLDEPKTELHGALISLISTHFPEMPQFRKELAALDFYETTHNKKC